MANISKIPQVSSAETSSDFLLLETASGTRKILPDDLGISSGGEVYGNAGFHNSIFRGKNLGSSFTAAQQAAISSGTFDDLYLGDYWTINGHKYVIGGFNYWKNHGDTKFTSNHLAMIYETGITAQMHGSNVTSQGYVGSLMYTNTIPTLDTTVQTDFGSAHVLTRREYLCNAATDGKASGFSWYSVRCVLMNEPMVYGSYICATEYVTTDKTILPIFLMNPESQNTGSWWWLRDPVSSATFADVHSYGYATNSAYASNSGHVRVAFPLI